MRVPWIFAVVALCAGLAASPAAARGGADGEFGAFLDRYCLSCHDAASRKGGLNLEEAGAIAAHPDVWEKVVRRLDTRQMPPAQRNKRPSEPEYQRAVEMLEQRLDAHAGRHPFVGEVPAMRRLTRTEYRNAVEHLLGISVDVAELLPKDESSHGFDNVTVGELSSTHLNRYISAAEKISRVAVADPGAPAQVRVVRVPGDRTQRDHIEGLPLGTRGGIAFTHTFPADGEYEIEARLARDRNEEVEGLHGEHEVVVLVDRATVAEFKVAPPPGRKDFSKVDAHLRKRVAVAAGDRSVGVTFPQRALALLETAREPYEAQFNMHRHPRQQPAIFQVTILGPLPAGDSQPDEHHGAAQRQRLEADARAWLASLLPRAFRKPLAPADLERAVRFYRDGRDEGGHRHGMQRALTSVLTSPQFLFRIERTPPDIPRGAPFRLDGFALATRLAFFLWSSLPDDELLAAAAAGELDDAAAVEEQVRRMLADPRARSLSTNFANQWLQLRNLASMAPDLREFPDFDDNLRTALVRETEMFFQAIVDEDRPVVDLLRADFTFLNERLARHYGIPHVAGSRMRRAALDAHPERGGLLTHGSILMVTSYPHRTSPVLRGNWVLENVLGTPTPPPPPDIPALEDANVDASLPMRERLAAHRAIASCATCHNLMDPIGFALEGFDAVGRVRSHHKSLAGVAEVDASGALPDGRTVDGAAALQTQLAARPDLFARTLTEKLMTFALGRGLEPRDAPAVRAIVDAAAPRGYRFSDLAVGVAQSVPFTMRTSR